MHFWIKPLSQTSSSGNRDSTSCYKWQHWKQDFRGPSSRKQGQSGQGLWTAGTGWRPSSIGSATSSQALTSGIIQVSERERRGGGLGGGRRGGERSPAAGTEAGKRGPRWGCKFKRRILYKFMFVSRRLSHCPYEVHLREAFQRSPSALVKGRQVRPSEARPLPQRCSTKTAPLHNLLPGDPRSGCQLEAQAANFHLGSDMMKHWNRSRRDRQRLQFPHPT